MLLNDGDSAKAPSSPAPLSFVGAPAMSPGEAAGASGDLLTPAEQSAASTLPTPSRTQCVSRIILAATYCFGTAMGIWLIVRLATMQSGESDYAFFISGVFVGLAVPLTLHDINMHMVRG